MCVRACVYTVVVAASWCGVAQLAQTACGHPVGSVWSTIPDLCGYEHQATVAKVGWTYFPSAIQQPVLLLEDALLLCSATLRQKKGPTTLLLLSSAAVTYSFFSVYTIDK